MFERANTRSSDHRMSIIRAEDIPKEEPEEVIGPESSSVELVGKDVPEERGR